MILSAGLVLGLMPKESFAADYDGDGKADFAWFIPETRNWRIYKSSAYYNEEILPRPNIGGSKYDIPLAADFDGDKITDLVLFRVNTGKIWVKESSTGRSWASGQGDPTWVPAVADYDGDGKADFAWLIPSTREWKILESSSKDYQERLPREVFGEPNDLPIPADYDGDGKADLAVFSKSSGKIHLKESFTGQIKDSTYGLPTWIPAVADYDGDGKADFAWFIPATQVLRVYESSKNYQERLPRQKIGGPDDIPIPADYDGDGKADLAVFRIATGKIWVKESTTENTQASEYGSPKWIYPAENYSYICHLFRKAIKKNSSSIEPFFSLHFGFGAGWEALEGLNMKWDRPMPGGPHPAPFNRHFIEKEKGVYDFTVPDGYVIKAQERGILTLATIWPYTEWDQEYWINYYGSGWISSPGFESDLPASRYKPHDMEAYRRFVYAMVERYDADGIADMPGLRYPIKFWEVINEVEMENNTSMRFFVGGPGDYLEVLQATYRTIKAADDKGPVVLNGGAAGSTTDTERRYWEELFRLGAREYFDVGNFHGGNAGDQDFYWITLFLLTHKLPIVWVTEFDVNLEGNDEQTQARKLVQWCAERFASGVDKIFGTFYSQSGSLELDGCKKALIYNGKPRQSYYAMKTLVKKLEGFSSAKNFHGQGDSNTYRFDFGGRPIYVIFQGGDLALIKIEIGGSVIVTDMLGNVARIDDVLQLGTRSSTIFKHLNPVYIERAP